MKSTNTIKIISFDVEGTLVTTDFSYAVWFEAIPQKYAQKYNISFEQAKKKVLSEYEKVGDQRVEWYDIKYWLQKFDLGEYKPLMEAYQDRVQYFPEVSEMLSTLGKRYILTVASGSPREFLHHLLRDIENHFHKVFSSISDFRQIKTEKFYSEICQDLNIRPDQVLHVGDSWEYDYVSANKIGINALYLDRNKRNNQEDSLEDLTQLIRFLPQL